MHRLFLFFFFLYITTFSQSIENMALPHITHYDTKNMGYDAKSWDIKQDENGMLYIANGNKILIYDGTSWRSVVTNAERTNRSILVKNKDSIYFGADGYHGLLTSTEFSDYNISFLHNSNLNNKSVAADIEEYWKTHYVDDQVIFQTFRNLYVNQDNVITKIPAPYRFRWSYMVNGQVYVNDYKYGVFKLQGTNLIPVISDQELNEYIIGVVEIEDELFIITDTKGIFKLKNNKLVSINFSISDELILNQVFSFLKLRDNKIALGTVSNGLYILDTKTGKAENLNKKTGLQNNTILSIYQDDESNLWLALDYGVDYVKLNSHLQYYYDYYGELGTTYAAIIEKNLLYLGTNQGLYVVDTKNNTTNNDFELLLNGQVWNIEKVKDQIYIGHDKGAYIVDKKTVTKIGDDQGAWNFRSIPIPGQPEEGILSGNYNGVSLYKKEEEKWVGYKLKGFEKSARYLELDQENHVWLALRKEGVFRYKLDVINKELKNPVFYPVENFGGKTLSLSKVENEIVITANFHSFTYSVENSNFIKKEIGTVKGEAPKIYTDGDETWYLENDRAVVENKERIKVFHELNDQLIPDLLNIFPLHDKNKIIPVFNGFSMYTKNKEVTIKNFRNSVLIRDFVSVNSNKTYTQNSEIPFSDNNLKVGYALPIYGEKVMYKIKINDQQWSDWTTKTEQTLYALDEGPYDLYLKARYNGDVKETKFSFKIKPPIYRTPSAYLVYFLLFLFLIFTGVTINRYKMKKQEKKLLEQKTHKLLKQEEEHKAQKLEQERKIIELNNSKLQDEIKAKSRELTQIAYVNLNKNKILKKIRDKVIKIQETSSQKLPTNSYNELIRLVEYYITDKESKLFEINFDKSHQDFYEKLSNNYPDLTSKDLRLCAYLKMNLSSKEIAPLLGISSQSVDVSRHRLRKKLNLGSKDNLTSILISLK